MIYRKSRLRQASYSKGHKVSREPSRKHLIKNTLRPFSKTSSWVPNPTMDHIERWSIKAGRQRNKIRSRRRLIRSKMPATNANTTRKTLNLKPKAMKSKNKQMSRNGKAKVIVVVELRNNTTTLERTNSKKKVKRLCIVRLRSLRVNPRRSWSNHRSLQAARSRAHPAKSSQKLQSTLKIVLGRWCVVTTSESHLEQQTKRK